MTSTKEVSILAIVHNGKLALETQVHQDRETLFCPGNQSKGVSELVEKILGKGYADEIQKFGRVVDVIIKPGEEVKLIIDVYKIEISDAANVQLPENFSWYTKQQLATDQRGKRDKQLYLRLLESKPLNVEYSEEQLAAWIDAKILYWHEQS